MFFEKYAARPVLIGLLCAAAAVADTASSKAGVRRYGNMPLYFEANCGQAPPDVRFLSRGAGHMLSLTDSQALLRFKTLGRSGSVGLRWVGGRSVTPEPEERQPGVTNYLVGADRSKWKAGIPHFGKVRYQSIYPGIDVVFYGRENRLEFDMILAPGADASAVRLQFAGAAKISRDRAGDLLIHANGTDLRQLRPVAYQDLASGRRYVPADYVVTASNDVKLKLASYDRSAPLIVDPVITWAAYLGGTSVDLAAAIAVDSSNNAYVTGYAFSPGISTAGTFDTTQNGDVDAYVAKINAAGTAFTYITYLGGSGSDTGHGIAVDSLGNAVVVGETNSAAATFPLVNALDGTQGGGLDGFAAKLNAAGNALVFSTYLGGTGEDRALGVAIDSADSIYLTGFTASNNFTAAAGSGYGGLTDAFVVKLTPAGGLGYSVYQGGSGDDFGLGVAIDTLGNAHVGGYTSSANLTGQGFQPSLRGAQDGFVAKLNGTGVRQYWAYLGGSDLDIIVAVALDATGNIYVVGDTQSTNFPIVRGVQSAPAGELDSFVAKLNNAASAVVFSSYIGGELDEHATGVAVEPGGSVAVSGYTASTAFPRINSVNTSLRGDYDAFVVKYTPSGNARYYSALLGGDGEDKAFGIALDSSGRAYVAGQATAAGLTTTVANGAFHGGAFDGFAARLSGCSVAVTPLETGIAARGGRRAIQVQTTPDCDWAAASGSAFVTLSGATSGSGNGFVVYDVAPNPGEARSGSVTVAGQVIPVGQQGSVTPGCSYTVSQPAVPAIAPIGGAGSFTISTGSNCTWSVYTNAGWAQVFPVTGSGPATVAVSYNAFPNFRTAARTATITAAGQTRTVTQGAGVGTSNERLVQLIYFSFLGRLPSASELSFQVSQLNSGTPRGDLIMSFFNSEEFNQAGRFIDGLYVGLLDRDAEYDGWLFQRNALATGGITQAKLVQNFLESAEYALRFGAPDNAEFVRLLYRHIFGREASQQEVDLQIGSLNSGSFTRLSMATFFLNSQEFRIGTGPRLSAFLVFATLLQRDPSLAEFETRIAELSSGQKTVRQIVDEIVATAEFNGTLL
jgi:hypothetical protein